MQLVTVIGFERKMFLKDIANPADCLADCSTLAFFADTSGDQVDDFLPFLLLDPGVDAAVSKDPDSALKH